MDDYNVKQIGDFPSATEITDEDVLLAEQAGKTRKLSGKVLKDFCRAAISAFTTRAETAATAAEAAKNAAAEIEQLIGEKAGVASFNGRSGLVLPQSGDYTAADVGAAPAGYGLGTVAKRLTDTDDLNNIWECGYYYWESKKPANAPYTYCVMHVYSTANNRIVQEIICQLALANQSSAGNMKVRRINWSGTIVEEYENPRMIIGEEYRTTERFNGKPVYVQARQMTGPAAGVNYKDAYIGIGDDVAAENVISVTAFTSGGYTLQIGNNYISEALFVVATPSVGISPTNQITVTIGRHGGSIDWSGKTYNVIVKYTKTS